MEYVRYDQKEYPVILCKQFLQNRISSLYLSNQCLRVIPLTLYSSFSSRRGLPLHHFQGDVFKPGRALSLSSACNSFLRLRAQHQSRASCRTQATLGLPVFSSIDLKNCRMFLDYVCFEPSSAEIKKTLKCFKAYIMSYFVRFGKRIQGTWKSENTTYL